MPTTVIRISCTRAEAEAALLADDPFPGVTPAPTLVASGDGECWELRLYAERNADAELLAALAALAPSAAAPVTEALADEDWVTLSQAGLPPVRIGRFRIHAGRNDGGGRPGEWPIRIDAGLAFGTGHHATTAGSIRVAAALARRHPKRNILDVGSGSGVLAFAAHRLFPAAQITATDLDPVAVAVAGGNAGKNRVPRGLRRGAVAFRTAAGVRHPLVLARAPYDLVFANILAGPLVAMAPALAAVVAKHGHIILAGLLAPQAQRVLAAYRAHGLLAVPGPRRGEWPVLLLRKAGRPGSATARRAAPRLLNDTMNGLFR